MWPSPPSDAPGPKAALAALQPGLCNLLAIPPLAAASRKISADSQSEDRWLFSFPREALHDPDGPNALAALTGISLPDPIRAHWRRASLIHLGYDGTDPAGGQIMKLYLEFAPPTAPEPGLAYLAVKSGRTQALHRYVQITDPAALMADLALPDAMVAILARLAAPSDSILRVSEDSSARLSMDVNLADIPPDAGLWQDMSDLVALTNRNAAPLRHWPSHIAVGRDARGMPFVTLYGWPDGPMP